MKGPAILVFRRNRTSRCCWNAVAMNMTTCGHSCAGASAPWPQLLNGSDNSNPRQVESKQQTQCCIDIKMSCLGLGRNHAADGRVCSTFNIKTSVPRETRQESSLSDQDRWTSQFAIGRRRQIRTTRCHLGSLW